MADDMRMSPGVADHRKIERLCRVLGDGAFRCLVRLWGYAADERKDGRLSSMTKEDIEAEARWNGEPGAFVRTLLATKLLDRQAGGEGGSTLALHNWNARQPYITSYAERSVKAAENARVGWQKRRQADTVTGNATRMQPASDPHADRNANRCDPHAPSPPTYPPTPQPTSPPSNHPTDGGHREGGGYGGRKAPHPIATAGEDAGSAEPPPPPSPPYTSRGSREPEGQEREAASPGAVESCIVDRGRPKTAEEARARIRELTEIARRAPDPRRRRRGGEFRKAADLDTAPPTPAEEARIAELREQGRQLLASGAARVEHDGTVVLKVGSSVGKTEADDTLQRAEAVRIAADQQLDEDVPPPPPEGAAEGAT